MATARSVDGMNRMSRTAAPDYDALVVRIAHSRDRLAYETLFRHFAPRLKAWLIRAGMAEGAAEEVAQETMLNVWRKAEQFRPDRATATTWIFTIARNLRIDHVRRDLRRVLPDHDPSDDPAPPPAADADILAAERDERIREAMALLPPEQLAALRLSFFEDRPHSDIAETLSIPLGTVKSRLRRAVQTLRIMLKDIA